MEQNSKLSTDILKIYEQYFLLFPEYYKVFTELINNIIYKDNDNSFSLQFKLFYGFMASSTLKCEYLLEDFIRIFLLLDGDKSWVEEGLKCKNIPEHIKEMATINNILAHKPWIMDWRHFSCFKNGLTVFLFQSAVILTTIQRISSIISSLNLLIHYENNKNNKEIKINGDNIEEKKENDEEKKIKEIKDNENKKRKKKQRNLAIEEEIQKVIKLVKNNCTENREEEKNNEIIKSDITKKYMFDLIIDYTDFNQHSDEYLSEEDFNWKTNAKNFFYDYAGKEMDYLNKELNVLENINSEVTTGKKINVYKARTGIEKYLSLIYGIKDDDYDYHFINQTLNVEIKRIIKKVACYPETIKEQELASCLEVITEKELVYLIFIVTSIKQKISLTYFAKAFDDFTCNGRPSK